MRRLARLARRLPGAQHLLRLPIWIGYRRGPRLMSKLRKWWVVLRNPQARIRFAEPVYLGPGFSLHMPDGGTFVVGPGVEFRRGFRAELTGDAEITIGAGSVFTYYVLLQCQSTIAIGERCTFAQSALVVDGSHRFRDRERPMLAQGYDVRPIRIDDDVTVMAKCTIIADIGARSFIGANSVVTRPVPAHTLAVGAPARPIDYFGPKGLEPPGLELAAGEDDAAQR